MVLDERYTKGRQIMEATARVNGVDLDQMMETINAIKQDADLGQCTVRAHNKWVDGTLNRTMIKGFYGMGQEDESRTESFELLADEPPALAGENRGANPVEYLLTGLAGCLTELMELCQFSPVFDTVTSPTPVSVDIELV